MKSQCAVNNFELTKSNAWSCHTRKPSLKITWGFSQLITAKEYAWDYVRHRYGSL